MSLKFETCKRHLLLLRSRMSNGRDVVFICDGHQDRQKLADVVVDQVQGGDVVEVDPVIALLDFLKLFLRRSCR